MTKPRVDEPAESQPAESQPAESQQAEPLNASRIQAYLHESGASWGQPLSVLAETRSSNDDARAAALSGAPHGAAFLADAQSAGRGRGHHRWHSPARRNIYLSLLLRPTIAPTRLSALTLAVGVAVADVIDAELASPRARIKWPNDVLVADRKLAGILLESSVRMLAQTPEVSLVIGVGLNVNIVHFPPPLCETASSLQLLLGRPCDRERLIATLIAAIERRADAYAEHGLAPLLASYRARDALFGKALTVGPHSGRGEGIDDSGRLLLRLADGELLPISSGEVSWSPTES